jgi:hypothetical protein
LTSDTYSRPAITIRSHNLHIVNIRRTMGEIASYHERLALSFFGILQVMHLLTFLWPSLFVSLTMVLTIDLLLNFCDRDIVILKSLEQHD